LAGLSVLYAVQPQVVAVEGSGDDHVVVLGENRVGN